MREPVPTMVKVCKFLWPMNDWKPTPKSGKLGTLHLDGAASGAESFYENDRDDLAQLEHEMIRRGHGERYGYALCREVLGLHQPGVAVCATSWAHVAEIRDATPAQIVQALSATVDLALGGQVKTKPVRVEEAPRD